MDSGNGPPNAFLSAPNVSSQSIPSPSRGARWAVADSDPNDTDLGTISPQKLANEVKEPKAYILV